MTNIKFAVVREDPIIEQAVIGMLKPENILMIASGGCTALSLKMLFPLINFTLLDLNPAQLQLVQEKIKILSDPKQINLQQVFNIKEDNPLGLNGAGEFESLFRSFRSFINEFIEPIETIKDIFLASEIQSKKIINTLVNHKYWPVSFDLYFSESLLLTMFGTAAIQHARPGSYPRYFQQAIEKGLLRADYKNNYFLQHILLGYYINDYDSCPYYLTTKASKINFDYISVDLMRIAELKKFQIISLSNIFDWMSEQEITLYLNHLNENLQPGAYLIYRQLNNEKDYISNIKGLRANRKLEKELLLKDRSLFYNKINLIEKL